MDNGVDFDRLEAAIGKLILACSRVEYELLRLYRSWMPSRDYFRDSYAKRYDRAIGEAKQKVGETHEMVEMLISMRKLSSLRHQVAHNPIHHVTSRDRESHGISAEFAIFDQKGSEAPLSLDDLESQAADAYRLSVRLAVSLRTNV